MCRCGRDQEGCRIQLNHEKRYLPSLTSAGPVPFAEDILGAFSRAKGLGLGMDGSALPTTRAALQCSPRSGSGSQLLFQPTWHHLAGWFWLPGSGAGSGAGAGSGCVQLRCVTARVPRRSAADGTMDGQYRCGDSTLHLGERGSRFKTSQRRCRYAC